MPDKALKGRYNNSPGWNEMKPRVNEERVKTAQVYRLKMPGGCMRRNVGWGLKARNHPRFCPQEIKYYGICYWTSTDPALKEEGGEIFVLKTTPGFIFTHPPVPL